MKQPDAVVVLHVPGTQVPTFWRAASADVPILVGWSAGPVHPAVIESYQSGLIHRFRSLEALRARRGAAPRRRGSSAQAVAVALERASVYALEEDELFTLHLLRSASC